MISYILSVIGGCFLVGAIAVAVINSRRGGSARERWVKYAAYLLIVSAVIAAIITGSWYFTALAAVIATLGYYELFLSGIRKGDALLLVNGLLIYTILLAGFVGFVLNAGASALLAVYFTVVLFDGFSQLCGQLFGKRKIAPIISPNKTVEGFAGGWIITMLCSAYVFLSYSPDIKVLITWIGICPAALAGDLAASYYKRRTGIKDYSELIPGHGGVLDRFDSLIAVYAYCFLINFILD
jgi:phosphatidate cytidylyltransferase